MPKLLPLSPSGTMNTAAPDGTPPRRIGGKNSKKSLPPVPMRGPEAFVLRREYDFYESGVNRIDSCLFLQNLIIPVTPHW